MKIMYWLKDNPKPYLIKISLKRWLEKVQTLDGVAKWQEDTSRIEIVKVG